MANELLAQEKTVLPAARNNPGDVFMNISAFEDAQRMAKMLAASSLVPKTFQQNVGDCTIALEMAQRIGASPLMVMQNLYLVYGKPAWSSQFLIACINASRKFTPLRYRMSGEKGKDSYGCVAWAKDNDGEILESPEITIAMAKAEGWYTKNGSKWQTMPELMLRYRCATLFARTFAPELTMGIQSEDEVIDVTPVVTEARPSRFETLPPAGTDKESAPAAPASQPSDLDRLRKLIAERNIPVTAEQVRDFVEKNGELFRFPLVEPNIDAIAEAILNGGE